jgi:hypothetical protein
MEGCTHRILYQLSDGHIGRRNSALTVRSIQYFEPCRVENVDSLTLGLKNVPRRLRFASMASSGSEFPWDAQMPSKRGQSYMTFVSLRCPIHWGCCRCHWGMRGASDSLCWQVGHSLKSIAESWKKPASLRFALCYWRLKRPMDKRTWFGRCIEGGLNRWGSMTVGDSEKWEETVSKVRGDYCLTWQFFLKVTRRIRGQCLVR